MEKLQELAQLWQQSKSTVILSGAGMSTASGIPDFRSKTGLWKKNPESLATLNALYNMPDEFYFFYCWRITKLWQIAPNAGHQFLAKAEQNNMVDLIVTQNVDGLHQRAGNKKVTELHGRLHTVSCLKCKQNFSSKIMSCDDIEDKKDKYKYTKECLCSECGGFLRPDVVLFGEMLPTDNWQKSVEAAKNADLIIVLGSSLLVGPANQIPDYTLSNGGKLVIINNDKTHLDKYASIVINDDIVKTLADLEKQFDWS